MGANDGDDTIVDFEFTRGAALADNDVINLIELLSLSDSDNIYDYLTLNNNGDDPVLEIDVHGGNGNGVNVTITLLNQNSDLNLADMINYGGIAYDEDHVYDTLFGHVIFIP